LGADKHGGNGGSRPFGDGRPPVVSIPRGCLGCEMGGNHDGGVFRGRANHDGGVDRGYDNNNGGVVYGRDKNAMVASSAAAPSDLARCDKPALKGDPSTIVTSAVAMTLAPAARQLGNVGGAVERVGPQRGRDNQGGCRDGRGRGGCGFRPCACKHWQGWRRQHGGQRGGGIKRANGGGRSVRAYRLPVTHTAIGNDATMWVEVCTVATAATVPAAPAAAP